MPNWCSNWAELTAPSTQAFDNFVAHMEKHFSWVPPEEDVDDAQKEEPAGFCGYFVPEPDYNAVEVFPAHPELHKNPDAYRMPGWWDFRVSNWGTKWEIGLSRDQITFDRESLSISMSFDSAWSPPLGVYESATTQEWSVDAHYCEPGMDFIGYYTSAEGEMSFTLGSRSTTDAPDWLVEAYDYEYDNIDEYMRECDLDELSSREEYLAKWGEEYVHEWDNFHKQADAN